MTTALVAERVRLLVQQVLDEVGASKTEAAAQLGIGSSILTKLEDPTRGVDLKTVTTIISRMRLDPDFFFSPELVGSHYRYYLLRKESPPPSWREFLDRWPRASELSEQDRDRILAAAIESKVDSWQSWAALAGWYLDHRRIDRES